MAEYLLAEVLDRQPEPVRRLLLRTSILDSVNGELADLLTGASGGEAVLRDLEAANAFVVAVDANRSWFRYHHLFADLLQLELRRAAPDEIVGLRRRRRTGSPGTGGRWRLSDTPRPHGSGSSPARLLAEHWPGFHLDGQAATTHQLLATFPAEWRASDAELAVLSAADELTQGSLETAERYLAVADGAMAAVPDAQQAEAELLLGITRLLHARQRGNLPAVAEEARPAAGNSRRTRGCATWPGRGPASAGADNPRQRRVLGRPDSTRPSVTWNRGWRWHGGSDGPIWSSPA